MNENVNEKNFGFTMRNVLRVLAILCIIFVFCPSFLVSCSEESMYEESMSISVMTAVKGVSESGQQIVEPHPFMLVCLLLPIAILALLFIKKFADWKAAAIILGCSAVDLVIWSKFQSSVKEFAKENYCTVETTRWYVINKIVLILIILLAAIVVLSKMKMDADLIAIFSGGGIQNALNQMSSAVPVSSEAEAAKGAASGSGERPAFCSQCGAKLEPNAVFCMSCGTKIK